MLVKVISEVHSGELLTLFASSGYNNMGFLWQTLHNAFELSPSTISKNFQTPLLRDWAIITLSCVADATDLVSCLKQ